MRKLIGMKGKSPLSSRSVTSRTVSQKRAPKEITIHENGIEHPLVFIVEVKKTDMIDVMETSMVIEDETPITDTTITREAPHAEVLIDGVEAANLTTVAPLDTREVEETIPLSKEVVKEVVEEPNLIHAKEE